MAPSWTSPTTTITTTVVHKTNTSRSLPGHAQSAPLIPASTPISAQVNPTTEEGKVSLAVEPLLAPTVTITTSETTEPGIPEQPYTPHPLTRFACASTAACTSEFITYPLEALIIRLQMQEGFAMGLSGMAVSVVKNEGVTTLWKGAVPALCRQVVTGGLGVGMYPVVRKIYSGDSDSPQLYHRILAGSTTGTLAQAVAQPLDIVKVRLQVQAKEVAMGKPPVYTGMMDAFKKIWAADGMPGFFRGLNPSLFRAAAQYGAGTATYDTVKSSLIHTWDFPDTVPTHMASSACSGFATAVAGCPADVIKTRMIAQIGKEKLYSGTIDCIMQTVKKDGIRSMYKGFLPTWMRLAPWQMIFFVAFEQISLAATGHTFQAK